MLMVIFYNSYILCNGCLSVSLDQNIIKEEKKGKHFFEEIRAHTFGHGITEDNLGIFFLMF